MQVTETLSDGLRRSYAVRVPADEIAQNAKARLAEISKNLRLPGFRPGKVPANLVRQRYGTSVMADVLQEAVNGAADRLISDRQLRPAGQPRVSLESQPKLDAAPEDLDLKVELELLPDITLPDLSTLSLTRLKSEPSEETVQRSLDSIAAQNRTFEDIEPARPAEKGDFLVADFTGTIDGIAFPGGSGTEQMLEVGGAGFVPGFAEQLEGITPGETRTIEVTFPADYPGAEVAGKAAQFEIVAKGLKRAIVPAQDDALASKIGFESFDKLREAVVAQIQGEYDQLSRLRIKRELLDKLAEDANFPSPQNLLDAEFAAIWQRVEADLQAGRIDDEDKGKDEATLKEEYRAIADRRVRLGLLLAEIGRANNVVVSQSEMNAALRSELSRYPGQEQQVLTFFQKNPGAVEQLRGPIFEDKVVDLILGQATVTESMVSPEELAIAPDLDSAAKPAVTLEDAPAAEAAPVDDGANAAEATDAA